MELPRLQNEATLRLLRSHSDEPDGAVTAVASESSLEVSIEIEMTAPSEMENHA
jgi:hypothetical protein